ncbi:MAG: putative molybdenum cofactor biosynthesis protein [Acidimicrobiales bacterium]|nr:putative molybdenum cofactor biosynthesis protein [Acidimicrobiales bacterium]
MGAAKALVEIDGVAMAAWVARALHGCGAERVVLVGGDPDWSPRLGLPLLPDRWPGQGPLGGLATALLDGPGDEAVEDHVVVVAACDQPYLDAPSLRQLVDALQAATGVQAAAAVDGTGRRIPFPAAWRASEGPRLARLVEGGTRRADAAFAQVTVVDVALAPGALVDIDHPGDLTP